MYSTRVLDNKIEAQIGVTGMFYWSCVCVRNAADNNYYGAQQTRDEGSSSHVFECRWNFHMREGLSGGGEQEVWSNV